MNKVRKFFKIAFFILIVSFISASYFNYITPKVKADSGFDGGYDGGGSDWGGDSDWDSGSSWDSGSNSGSGNNNEPLGAVGSFFVLIAIFIIMFINILAITTGKHSRKFASSNANNNHSGDHNRIVPYDITKISSIVPNFNLEEFKNTTYDIYKKVQVAWMNFDTDNLRNLVTDEMYNMYVSQLETLKIKNQQNIMSDFELCDFEIIGMENDKTNIAITVAMLISCHDYIIDEYTAETLRGRKDKEVLYHYNMTFIRSINSNSINYCPNCGAPVSDKASRKCSYCDSIIVSDNHDLVLAKKQVIEQHYL